MAAKRERDAYRPGERLWVKEAVKGGSNRKTALTAATAAAVGGAATYAVKRAVSNDDSSNSQGKTGDSGAPRRASGASSILLSAAWNMRQAAAHVLIPIAEDMAESAGRYVAEHGPDIVRNRIVPRFIEAFEDAR